MHVTADFAPNTPGIFAGVPAEVYHAAPGVSNSSLKAMSRSPLDYHRYREKLVDRDQTEYMQYGQLFHSACLENRSLAELCYVQPALYADGTKPWHNGARECKVWNEMHADKPILSKFDYDWLLKEVKYVKDHRKVMGLMLGGWIELSCFAIDPATGLLLKGRMDNVRRNQGVVCITDLKTTQDASTEGFAKEILKRKYHVQAAMYRRIIKLLVPDIEVLYAFIAVEKGKCMKVNVRYLARQAMDLGDKEIDANLEKLAECQRTNRWPEWSDETDQVEFIDLPDFCYTEETLTGLTSSTFE